MNVKQLIRELQVYPKHLEVGVAMHDNTEYEIAGDVFSVKHFIKHDHDPESMSVEDRKCFNNMPHDCIIIRC